MEAAGFSDSFLRGRRLLIVSPHPDDETLGCGGLIAKAKANGASVYVMVISAPRVLKHYHNNQAEVSGSTRRRELSRAMTVLGVDQYCVGFETDDVHMRLDAMAQLDLVKFIEHDSELSIDRVRPDILCFPAASYNQDHRAVFTAVIAACRPHLAKNKAFVPVVLAYDQPQLSWNDAPFHPNTYVDITGFLSAKLAAYACYESQVQPEPHHASLENLERLARLRGSEVSVEAAEAFHCHRLLV